MAEKDAKILKAERKAARRAEMEKRGELRSRGLLIRQRGHHVGSQEVVCRQFEHPELDEQAAGVATALELCAKVRVQF